MGTEHLQVQLTEVQQSVKNEEAGCICAHRWTGDGLSLSKEAGKRKEMILDEPQWLQRRWCVRRWEHESFKVIVTGLFFAFPFNCSVPVYVSVSHPPPFC